MSAPVPHPKLTPTSPRTSASICQSPARPRGSVSSRVLAVLVAGRVRVRLPARTAARAATPLSRTARARSRSMSSSRTRCSARARWRCRASRARSRRPRSIRAPPATCGAGSSISATRSKRASCSPRSIRRISTRSCRRRARSSRRRKAAVKQMRGAARLLEVERDALPEPRAIRSWSRAARSSRPRRRR